MNRHFLKENIKMVSKAFKNLTICLGNKNQSSSISHHNSKTDLYEKDRNNNAGDDVAKDILFNSQWDCCVALLLL